MKLRKMFLSVMIALAVLTLTLPPRAFAQTPDHLASLQISLWLEFVKPTVLVLLDGLLSSNLFLLIALVALGVSAIPGFFLLQHRSQATRPAPNMATGKPRRGKPRGGMAAVTAFCRQCGHKLGPEDSFWSKCGTKRRVLA